MILNSSCLTQSAVYMYACTCSDLGRMYQLVSRIQDGLGELRNLLEAHISSQGTHAIEKCGESALNVSSQRRVAALR